MWHTFSGSRSQYQRPQTVALFDMRVIDTEAQSYSNRDVASVLSSAAEGNTVMQQKHGVRHLHH